MKRCWLTMIGEISYLLICVLALVGAFAMTYRLVAGWRQGWMVW